MQYRNFFIKYLSIISIVCASLLSAGFLSCGKNNNQILANCGDGILQQAEQCDDGNLLSGDGCSEICQNENPSSPAICGNAQVEAGETCDDGNLQAGDGCSDLCQSEAPTFCGNGIKETGEQCDQSDLGAMSCQSLNAQWKGQLACKADCNYDTSACTWIRHLGGNNDDYLYSIAVSTDGSIYAAGAFYQEASFGGEKLLSAGENDIYLAKFDKDGVHQWSQRFGGTGKDAAFSVKLGPDASVYITGYFQGNVNFGGENQMSAGKSDIFVAKYSPAGELQWSRRFGSAEDDYGADLAIASDGSFYLTGYFEGTLNLGGQNLISNGGMDIFLAKYNSEGVHQWSYRFGNTKDDRSRSMALGPDGSVYFTGHFLETINLGGNDLSSNGGSDGFIASYNPAGNHLWSQSLGGPLDDFIESILIDAQGSAYLSGSLGTAISIDGNNLPNAGGSDGFVAKYDAPGKYQWGNSFGGVNNDYGRGLALGMDGSVYVSGGFRETINFGQTSLSSVGEVDTLVVKYSSNGAYQASQAFGGPFGDMGWALAQSSEGDLYLGGYFQGKANFGEFDLESLGGFDAFLLKLNVP